MLQIINAGSVLYEIANYTVNCDDMGKHNMSVELSLPVLYVNGVEKAVKFETSWHIAYNNDKYYLNTEKPTGTKNNDSTYIKYSLIFESKRNQLDYTLVKNVAYTYPPTNSGNADPSNGILGIEFTSEPSFFGNIYDFVSFVRKNLDYTFGLNNINIKIHNVEPLYDALGLITATREQQEASNDFYSRSDKVSLPSLSGVSIFQLLVQYNEKAKHRFDFYSEADKYWIVINKPINTIPKIFEYGGNASPEAKLLSITRTTNEAYMPNRIYGVGGNNNLPANYLLKREKVEGGAPIFITSTASVLTPLEGVTYLVPNPTFPYFYEKWMWFNSEWVSYSSTSEWYPPFPYYMAMYSSLMPECFRDYINGWWKGAKREAIALDSSKELKAGHVDGLASYINATPKIITYKPVTYYQDEESVLKHGVIETKKDFTDIYPSLVEEYYNGTEGNLGRLDEIVDVYVPPTGFYWNDELNITEENGIRTNNRVPFVYTPHHEVTRAVSISHNYYSPSSFVDSIISHNTPITLKRGQNLKIECSGIKLLPSLDFGHKGDVILKITVKVERQFVTGNQTGYSVNPSLNDGSGSFNETFVIPIKVVSSFYDKALAMEDRVHYELRNTTHISEFVGVVDNVRVYGYFIKGSTEFFKEAEDGEFYRCRRVLKDNYSGSDENWKYKIENVDERQYLKGFFNTAKEAENTISLNIDRHDKGTSPATYIVKIVTFFYKGDNYYSQYAYIPTWNLPELKTVATAFENWDLTTKTFFIWTKNLFFNPQHELFKIDDNVFLTFQNGMMAGQKFRISSVHSELTERGVYDSWDRDINCQDKDGLDIAVNSRYCIELKSVGNTNENETAFAELPSAPNLVPKRGELFIIEGVRYPHDPYVLSAEKKLAEALKKELDQEARYTYGLTFDHINLDKLNIDYNQLRAGNKLRIRNNSLSNTTNLTYAEFTIKNVTIAKSNTELLNRYSVTVSNIAYKRTRAGFLADDSLNQRIDDLATAIDRNADSLDGVGYTTSQGLQQVRRLSTDNTTGLQRQLGNIPSGISVSSIFGEVERGSSVFGKKGNTIENKALFASKAINTKNKKIMTMTATFDRSLLFYFSKDMELAKIEPPFVVRDGTIALKEPLVIVTSLLGSFGIYPQDVPLIEDEVTYFYARVDTKHEETKLEVSDKIIEKTTDGDIQYLLIGYVNPVLDNEMQEIEYTYIEDASKFEDVRLVIPVYSGDRSKYVQHNLGFKPSVRMVKDNGELCWVTITHYDNDTLNVQWLGSIVGNILID